MGAAHSTTRGRAGRDHKRALFATHTSAAAITPSDADAKPVLVIAPRSNARALMNTLPELGYEYATAPLAARKGASESEESLPPPPRYSFVVGK